MKDATKVLLAAILGVIILEGIALARGIDGTLLSLSIGALCALAGIAFPSPTTIYTKSNRSLNRCWGCPCNLTTYINNSYCGICS